MPSPRAATAFANAVGAARPPERLLGLLRQHERLLADVRRKRKVFERAQEEVERVAAEVRRRLEPFIEESRRIDAELHALFGEVLRGGRLAKRARRAVARFYAELQRRGVLSEGRRAQPLDDDDAAPDFEGDQPDDEGPGAGRRRSGGPRPSSRANAAGDVPAAAPPSANPTLRSLFLRLARALHPDRVQDAREQAARTETMKEINRAYREGDVARLAELERLVTAQGGFAGAKEGAGAGLPLHEGDDGDDRDVEARCVALEQTNRALRDQLNTLRRDLRALWESEMGRLAAEIEQRSARGGKRDPFAELIADAAAEVQRFRAFRDHVRAFRDGSLALEDLLMGPLEDPDEDDLWYEDGAAAFEEGRGRRTSRRARHPSGPPKRGGAGRRRHR
ncbi:MAG TPA: J domain-containing protein [Polyangia bacterium]